MIEGVISKQDVINLIDEYGYVNCHDGRDFEANNRVDRVRQKVLELPDTSDTYDVERVVEQLNGMIEQNVDMDTGQSCDNWVVDMQNKLIRECIKIVIAGGVNVSDEMEGLKPCPRCKKKIVGIEKWYSGGPMYMVKCNNPNCPVPEDGYPKGRNLEKVKEEWNRQCSG